MAFSRSAYVALVCVAAVVAVAPVAAQSKPKLHESPVEEAAWHCEVCKAFCHEYEEKITEKQTDDHYELAIEWARGNTTNWRWDGKRHVLRSPLQGIGEEVIDEIEHELENTAISSSYVYHVVLHALQAAAHLDVPTKLPAHFCRRKLCEERMQVCEAHHDKRPYAVLTRNYEHLLHTFDRDHSDAEIHHPARRFNSHRSHVWEDGPADLEDRRQGDYDATYDEGAEHMEHAGNEEEHDAAWRRRRAYDPAMHREEGDHDQVLDHHTEF